MSSFQSGKFRRFSGVVVRVISLEIYWPKFLAITYQPVKRQGPFGAINFLGAFDLPDTNEETGRRTQSTVPEQALYLVNSPFAQDCGRALADRFMDRKPQQRIKCIYLAAFSRPPTAKEVESALSFINALTKEIRSEKKQRRQGIRGHGLGSFLSVAVDFKRILV